MRSFAGCALSLVLAAGLLAVVPVSAQSPTAAGWSGSIGVEFVEVEYSGHNVTGISEVSSKSEHVGGISRRVWVRLTFDPALPPPGTAGDHVAAGVVVCWSGTAKWSGPRADVDLDSDAANVYPLWGQLELPVRPLPGCSVFSLRHEATGSRFNRKLWDPGNAFTELDAVGNLVSAATFMGLIVPDDVWEADETVTATVMPVDVARLGCEDPNKPAPLRISPLPDCGDTFTPIGVDDAPSATLTITDNDEPVYGCPATPTRYPTTWLDTDGDGNPNGPSPSSLRHQNCGRRSSEVTLGTASPSPWERIYGRSPQLPPRLVTMTHTAAQHNPAPALADWPLSPARGDAAGDAYTVTVPPNTSGTITMTVDERNLHGPSGSVTVTPSQLDITPDSPRSHTITVTASDNARPGDSFVVRHRFSTDFGDGYIRSAKQKAPKESYTHWERDTAKEANGKANGDCKDGGGVTRRVDWTTGQCLKEVWGSRPVTIPRFDVAGRVSHAAAHDADAVDNSDVSDDSVVSDSEPAPPAADDRQQPQAQQQQPRQDAEPSDPAPQCDADTALLAVVEAKITRHRDVTGRADLAAEFTAVRNALTGDGPLDTARAHAYRRDGANTLWTQIAAHLRHNCR